MSEVPLILPEDSHNSTLLENVHPSQWKNPEPASRYNLVVIGAGTAGLVCAAGAAGLGAKVAIVERDLFGGDCLNTGCVPSKSLIRAARALRETRTAEKWGVFCGNVFVDFAKAMERMRRIRAGISTNDSVARFSRELNVDVFLGHAQFTGPDVVEVAGKRLRFKKGVVCTGSRPQIPPIPGLEDAGYLTNETVFQLTELPPRLAVIGGGPIGCELAQAFARFGSRVALFEQGQQLLPREDADAAAVVQRSLEADGVAVHCGSKLSNITLRGGEKVIAAEAGGREISLPVDSILAAAGRIPNVKDLGLEAAGIRYDLRQGVIVNDLLQTSNSRVYAAGDVCSSYKFTHAADAMARVVIANALFPARQKLSRLIIPWCTYTDPEVAHVGIHEKEARDRGILTLTVPFDNVDRAVLDGASEGFARVHLETRGKIAGATIIGRDAGETIGEIVLAMTAGLSLSAVGKAVHPYPTRSEALRKLSDQYNKTRLTSFVKNALKAWMRWQG